MHNQKHLVEQLGLFKLPREIRSIDKDREEKAFENQLVNNAKSFFNSGKNGEEQEGGDKIDRAAQAVQKKREKHLMQLDDTKRMYME